MDPSLLEAAMKKTPPASRKRPGCMVVAYLVLTILVLIGCKRVTDSAAAQPTTLFVSVVDAQGARFTGVGGRLSLWRDGVWVITKDLVGGSQQFDTRVTAKQYCVKPEPPAGYVSVSQVECSTGGNDYLTFIWIPAPPTATQTPSRTPTLTPTDKLPPASSTPTATLPPVTPTPMPKCYGFQQFSFAERWTILSTGAALIGRDIGEVIDWQNDETLAYATEINLGAPLTRPYTVTAADGSFIWCRAYCQGVIAIRQVWPCESERYGVVQWDGFENWTKGGS